MYWHSLCNCCHWHIRQYLDSYYSKTKENTRPWMISFTLKDFSNLITRYTSTVIAAKSIGTSGTIWVTIAYASCTFINIYMHKSINLSYLIGIFSLFLTYTIAIRIILEANFTTTNSSTTVWVHRTVLCREIAFRCYS